ncbi:MAG: histidinol dehydrogenase, partial [Actinobacteria bacterium]|nr:histidinol dehydrogenase [Actinomycetota bacterium]
MSPSERKAFAQRSLADVLTAPLQHEIAALIDDVRHRGDDAVCEATRRFDGVSLMPDQLRVS